MLDGASRAQCGDHIGETQLCQGHHIHIALGNQRITGLAQRATGFKQAIELPSFAEHRCFW